MVRQSESYRSRFIVCWLGCVQAGVTCPSPDSKIHGANMGPIWVLSAPDGPMLAPWTLLSGSVLFHWNWDNQLWLISLNGSNKTISMLTQKQQNRKRQNTIWIWVVSKISPKRWNQFNEIVFKKSRVISSSPGRCGCDFICVYYKYNVLNDILSVANEYLLRMNDNKFKLIHVFWWPYAITSPFWPRYPTPYGVIKPHWVKTYSVFQ